MNDCERYINTLEQFGFRRTAMDLGTLLYYSNLPEKEYLVETHSDGVCVTVTYAGHGSDV